MGARAMATAAAAAAAAGAAADHAGRRPIPFAGALVAALAWAALVPVATAQTGDASASDKDSAGKTALHAKRAAPSHAWHDGASRRTLVIESGLQADFSGALTGKSIALRPAAGALKDVSPSLQSPVFRDEGGRMRALPGGVVVMTRTTLDEPTARALLTAHDARPTRRLGERAWLVESAAGMASLELANRLAATGAFDAAQPNWWVERALK
jgi:hypothetical protein